MQRRPRLGGWSPDLARRVGLGGFLLALAFAGGHAPIPVFFGVDFVLGSVANLLLAVLYGPLLGVLGAVLGSMHETLAGSHPFAVVLLSLEALVVGLAVRRRQHPNLVLLDAGYWLLLGIPLGWVLNANVLGLDQMTTALLGLEQATNGVVNALITSLLLVFTPIRRWAARAAVGRPPLRLILFLFLVTAFAFPAVLLVVLEGRQQVHRIEQNLHQRVTVGSEALAREVADWRADHLAAVVALARSVEALEPGDDLQARVKLVVEAGRDFENAYVANASARTVAFYPPTNARGEPTLGLDFSDRPYVRQLRETLAPVISQPFVGRGGVDQPIVVLAAPVLREGRFAGYTLGAVRLVSLHRQLATALERTGLDATLVDHDGLVVASTRSRDAALSLFREGQVGEHEALGGGLYRWTPGGAQHNAHLWRDTLYGRELTVGKEDPWRLVVEAPLAPAREQLYALHIQRFAVMLAFVLIAVALAPLVARRLSAPLSHLAAATVDLPERLAGHEDIALPTGSVAEVAALVANFQRMLVALRAQFSDLEARRSELAERSTELAHLNARLEAAASSKDEFLAMLSHELRNPLSPLSTGLVLLRRRLDQGAPVEDLIEVMERQLGHLIRIVDDLLDVTRISRNRIELRMEALPLDRVVAEAAEALGPTIEAAGHRLSLQPLGEKATVHADPTRMVQVVGNLLSNAARYTHPGGHIEVTFGAEGGEAVIRVRDTGRGLSPEAQSRIFDPFVRAAPSSEPGAGLGLGLTLVQRLVRLHGGTVTARSEGVGRGSEFEIRLPLSKGASAGSRAGPSSEARASAPRRVLVVDDNEDVGNLLGELARDLGHEVEVVTEGKAALEAAARLRPGLVLLDIGLPDLSGYEVAARLRAELGREVLIVAITGYGQPEDRRRTKAAGFDRHLTKPLRGEDLEALLGGSGREGAL